MAAAIVATPPAFSLNGRLLAVEGSQRFNATLRWQQSDASRILITTPLGQALASIEADARGARLTAADGRRYNAASLADLARRGLGLSLPLDHLPWWLSGRAAPGCRLLRTATASLRPAGRFALQAVTPQGGHCASKPNAARAAAAHGWAHNQRP